MNDSSSKKQKNSIEVKEFFHKDTSTLTYVVYDPLSKDGIIIDSVLDYNLETGEHSYDAVKTLEKFIENNNITPHYFLETHVHADHLTACQYLKEAFPNGISGIGKEVCAVQDHFFPQLKLPEKWKNGAAFDKLFDDEEEIICGSLQFKVMRTPGHTPACVSYIFNNMVFTGDTLFMPDFGTARCDFPGGDCEDLYNSIHTKLYSLPDETIVYVGHDYMPGGRELRFSSTIGEEKSENIQLKSTTDKETFVNFRKNRDAGLNNPRLMQPSLKVNLVGGRIL